MVKKWQFWVVIRMVKKRQFLFLGGYYGGCISCSLGWLVRWLKRGCLRWLS